MKAFRKLILTEVEKRNRAGLMHAKRFTDKEMKCIVRIIEARPSLALKTQEIKFLIRMEGPTGIELKMAKIITPLMEGPTGFPFCRKNNIHERINHISHGKRRFKKADAYCP